MKNYNYHDYVKGKAYVLTNGEKIVEVSKPFMLMTEYSSEELLKKNIKELLQALRVGPNFNVESIEVDREYFMFTKSLEVRFVGINKIKVGNRQAYVFFEKAASCFESKFPSLEALCSHNKFGVAVFSTPDITLIKANETWLNFLDRPFNDPVNSIGRRISEIISGWVGSTSEDIWKSVLSTQQTFYSDEYMFEFERGVTYWEASLAPVFENGILKYCIEITTDMTEKVLNRKKIEEQAKIIEQQKRELEVILDNMPDGISIVDKEGRYTKINKTLKKWLNNKDPEKVGDSLSTFKYFDKQGRQLSKEEMPALCVARGERIEQYELLIDANGCKRYLSLNGTPIYDEKGNFLKSVINSRDITEIVHNREKLQEQFEEIKFKNKQLEAIFESMEESISIFDKQGRYLIKSNINKKQFEPTNNSVWEVGEKTDFYNMDGKFLPKEEHFYSKLMRGEKVKNLNMRLVTNGKEEYISISGTPILDENKEFQMGVIFSVDITDIVKLSEQIKQKNELLKRQAGLLDLSSEAILAWKLNGEIIYWNKGAEQKYGYSVKEALGSISHELLKTVFPTKLEDIKSILLKDRVWQGELKHTTRGGEKIIIDSRFQLIADEQGQQIVLETNRDITERKRLEEELRNRKEFLEAIIPNISDAIIVYDKNGNLMDINSTARDLSPYKGVKYRSIIDRYEANPPYDLDGNIIPYEEIPSVRIIKGEQLKNIRITYKVPRLLHLKINGIPIYDGEGNFIMGVICVEDVTKEVERENLIKEQQQLLLKAECERNEALEKVIMMKDEFLSLISHEFKTPINVINMAIQTLNHVYANQMTDNIKKYMGMIRQNANRQLRLVNNLLDITRANSGRIKIHKRNLDIVFMTKAIIESVNVFAAKKSIRITLASKLSKKIIAVDDEKYERILLNLLSNAVKFTPEGKTILVNLRLLKGKVCVEVKDSGIGIPSDKLEVIFERFGQVDSSLSRQAEGTGIGLSLVKKFVEALQGSISVKSKVGKGTAFKVLLPDETVVEESNEAPMVDLMNDNRLIQAMNVEFSDIYL